MGIFDKLKNAILGSNLHSGPVPSGTSSPSAQTSASQQRAGSTAQSGSPQPASQPQPSQASSQPQAAPAASQVDIDAVLTRLAGQKHEQLNWQSSIVDLMKVVDLDPSLENRKTLAHELGYTGNTQDSASMNVWLHREVMQQLAASGGKVPDSLRH